MTVNLRREITWRAALLMVIAGGAGVFPTFVRMMFIHNQGGWLPALESDGLSLTVYMYVTRLVTFLAVSVGALGLGYWSTNGLELVTAYRTFVATLLVGGATGFLLGTVGVGLVTPEIGPVRMLILGIVDDVDLLVEFILAAFAGAAFTEIRRVERESEGQPRADGNE